MVESFSNSGWWVVDQYCKMETQWLWWIRQHQKTIHAELYQGLQDAL
jgi:hypothetical protein